MPYSHIRAAADRHRAVATALTNPTDRAIVNSFADEVATLARFEFCVSDEQQAACSDRRSLISPILMKAFPQQYSSRFNDLLRALEHC